MIRAPDDSRTTAGRRRPRRWAWTALAVLLSAGPVPAAPPQGGGPVNLQADQAELNNRTGVSVYTGNVELTRGDTRITGDRMEVYTTDSRRLDKVVVTGKPATYRGRQSPEEPPVRGEAPRMAYFASDPERIELHEGARLWQGDNRFEGETIVYRVADDTVVADGTDDERINVTLFPEQRDGENR